MKKEELKKDVENKEEKYPRTYVITAAQGIQHEGHAFTYGKDSTKGAPNKELIENIDNYSGLKNAESMIIGMQGMDTSEMHLHPFFEGRKDVYINKNRLAKLESEIKNEKMKVIKKEESWAGREADYFKTIGIEPLNNKVVVADLIVPPQNVDPTTGRLDIPQNQLGKTIIFAHSKQRLKCAPKSMGRKYPRLLITTGAITHPNYNTSNGKGDIAFWNHKYGFVAVDVLDGKTFFPRIVPAFKNGTFVDLGIEYTPGKRPKKISTEAIILGDIHFGDHDETSMKASYEMMEYFNPKNVFLHDAFNGHSMNPHEREDTVKRAIAFQNGRLDVYKEFNENYNEFVDKMAKKFPKTNFWFVYSNHSPDFVKRYLTAGQYIKEPWNDTPFTGELRNALLKGKDPYQSGLELIASERNKKFPKNVNFLTLKYGKTILGYQLGAHGHKGINGSRGSPNSMKKGYSRGVSAHTHTPEINGDFTTVGTNSLIPLEYAEGQPGTWMPANDVIYSNGLSQLIPIIVGKWRK